MKYSLAVLLILFTLIGCTTPEERQAYERKRAAMTPRDKCIEQANTDTGICQLGALSIPNINERNRTQQQCSDRQMAMHDRCYARFK